MHGYFLAGNITSVVAFYLVIWMARGLAAGYGFSDRDYIGQDLEASCWQGNPSLVLGCLGILDDTSEDPHARYILRRR
jgi:hypothetical protein